MKSKIQKLALAMIGYDNGDPKRIQHTTKVHAYAALIGAEEGLDEATLFVLESAALVHDIGIRASEKKFGHQNGKLQEQEGPAVARELLSQLGSYTELQIDRICWLVAHHHTYHASEEMDYQILIEADFLVNLYEDNEPMEAIRAVRKNIFRTASGIKMLDTMFGLSAENETADGIKQSLLEDLFAEFSEKGYSAEDFYGGCSLCGDANDFALDIIDAAVLKALPEAAKEDREKLSNKLYTLLHQRFEEAE